MPVSSSSTQSQSIQRSRSNVRESLSNAKNTVYKSAEARRNSFKFNFFPSAAELVSVSSRAIMITTTGTGVADLAVLGLTRNTSVLVCSNESDALLEADAVAMASRHDTGEVRIACLSMPAAGVIERARLSGGLNV